jgi:ABC-2 type transport system ATP-binding protein
VFLTTHYMDEAEHLADRIAVIVDGEIVALGPPATLGGRDRMAARIRFTPPTGAGPLPASLGPLAETGADGAVTLASDAPLAHAGMLADWAFRGGFDLPDLDVRRPTLEEVYLSLTATDRKDRS